VESLFALLRKNVAYLFLVPVWLMRGKAYLKQQIAERVDLDVTLLPYHGPFLRYLREQRAAGRHLVLVTRHSPVNTRARSPHTSVFSRRCSRPTTRPTFPGPTSAPD
jgi:hypothetical protein